MRIFKKDRTDSPFFSPAVLATLITAIAAPISSYFINRHITKRDAQLKILESVIKATSGEDFSKVEAIQKIQLVTKIVEDNQDIFEIDLDSTKQFLYQKEIIRLDLVYTQRAIAEKERDEYVRRDSVKAKVILEKTTNLKILEEERERLKNKNNYSEKELKELNEKILKEKEVVSKLNLSLKENQQIIKQLDMSIEEKNKSIEESAREISKLQNERQISKQKLTEFSALIDSKSNENGKLLAALTETRDEIQRNQDYITKLELDLTSKNQEIIALSDKLKSNLDELDLYRNIKILNPYFKIPTRDLGLDSAGSDVRNLQKLLDDLGYRLNNFDGHFGELTRLKIIEFQSKAGLTDPKIHGRFEDQTRKALISYLKETLN